MEVKVCGFEQWCAIADIPKRVAIGISLTSHHVCEVTMEMNMLEQTVRGMAIDLNTLMSIITADIDMCDADLTAVLYIEWVGKVFDFYMFYR